MTLIEEVDRMPRPVRHPMPEQPTASDMSGQDAAVRDGKQVAGEELSPAEAVAAFHLSQATLRRLLTAGSLPARKVNGVRGLEWRIPASALEGAGYTRRAATDPEVVPQSEARRLRETLAAERARASQLDSQLGYALLTIGCLRGRLCAAGIDPDELFGADLASACDKDTSVSGESATTPPH